MQTAHKPSTLVFDVIGTLFSLESQRPRLVACGLPGHVLELWFAASLRDLFTLGATGRTVPMITVLEANLHHLLHQYRLRKGGARVDDVLAGMSQLEPEPDAAEALHLLRANALTCAALSNGSIQATEQLLDRASLRSCFAQVVSIDSVGLPKPRAEPYQAMATLLGRQPGEMMMVAAHPWDLHGARAAGLSTGFLSHGQPWPSSFEPPDLAAPDLLALAQQVCT